jgi:hypothetical protein
LWLEVVFYRYDAEYVVAGGEGKGVTFGDDGEVFGVCDPINIVALAICSE